MIHAIMRCLVPLRWHTALKRLAGGNPDEIGLVRIALQRVEKGQMVDVGAHRGGALRPFLAAGWRCLAFEPDAANRAALMERFGDLPELSVDSRAVSDKAANEQTFYTSAVSNGISSLQSFHPSHVAGEPVCVTTLDHALAEYKIGAIDFLKIDIEGLDLFALKGLDASVPVRAVMVEFEDRKTCSLGYSAADLASCLQARGFLVVASIWHPIVEYGRQHRWQKFALFPCTIDPKQWGNFIGFSRVADFEMFREAVHAGKYPATEL